jgi:hypothetical protein
MIGDPTRHGSWDDDDDDLPAVDFARADDRDGASALDALGDCSQVSDEESDQVLQALFTVTNPGGRCRRRRQLAAVCNRSSSLRT